jgi:RNA 3'-terminal phosphate cyclase (ATP)
MSNLVEIDGNHLEGGGQILRTACAFSAVTKKPCRIFNIRSARPKPGLAAQHLLGIQALAQLSGAKLEGDFLGSKEIKFHPNEIESKDIQIKIETAGSITLTLQALILPALLASKPLKITFEGGATDTFFSPTVDYFRYVYLKVLEKMNVKVKVNILKRGYYPEGGAKVEVTVYPAETKPIDLTKRGSLRKITVVSGASNILKNKKVAERQIAGVREVLGKLNLPTEEKLEYYQTKSPGSQICLNADFENTMIGTDNLGKLEKRAEDVGKEAALELLKEQKSNACLDKHLADQILPFMAFAEKKSHVTVSEITKHCKTNIWTIEKFTKGKFSLKEAELCQIIWNA